MFVKLSSSYVAATAAAALMIGSAAFGQTAVGGQDISDADLPAVTEHCETLATGADASVDPGSGNPDAEDTEMSTMEATPDDTMPTDGTEGNADADAAEIMPDTAEATDGTDGADGNVDADGFTGINLQDITLEDCEAAGLI